MKPARVPFMQCVQVDHRSEASTMSSAGILLAVFALASAYQRGMPPSVVVTGAIVAVERAPTHVLYV